MAFQFIREQVLTGQPDTTHYIYSGDVVIQIEQSKDDNHHSVRLSVSGGGLLICDMKSCNHNTYNSIMDCADDALKRYFGTKGTPKVIEFSLREGTLSNFGRNLVDDLSSLGYTLQTSRYSQLRGATKFIFVK